MKLRTVLAASFMIVTVLPIAALGVWFDRSAFEKEVDAVREKHLLLAGNLSAALARYAADLGSTFALARQRRDDLSIEPGLIEHLRSQHLRCVLWVRASDRRVVRQIGPESDCDPGAIEPLLAAAASGRRLGGLRLTGVRPDGEGRPTIFLVADDGDGHLSLAALATDRFVTLQRSIAFGDGGHAAIVDQSGRVLGHARAAWRAEMKDLSAVAPVGRMVAGETGVLPFFSPARQAQMIAGYTTVAEAGWGVMVVQPLAELTERAASERVVIGVVMAAGLIFAALVSWAFSGYLTGSILPIVAAAKANAAGRFGVEASAPSRLAPRELRELADSFNVLAREIERSHRSNAAALEVARQAEAEYRGIFDEAAIGIYRIGLDGRLIRANPALVRLHGYETEAEMLTSAADMPKQWYVDPGRQARIMRELLKRGRVTNLVSEVCRHRSRERIWVSEDLRAVHDGAGEVIYCEGTVLDITERKRAEEATRRAMEAETLNRTKSEFLATVSHELRTPLNAIIGFSEMMKQQELGSIGNARYAEYVADIHESGLNLLELIDDLLDLSKIEAGKLELRDELVDLAELIPGLLHNFERDLTKKELDLGVDLEADLPRLMADSRATERMLINLLSNAVKFTPQGGRIEVRAVLRGGAVRLAVADSGIGIAAADLQKVLAPFSQAENPLVRTRQGTGLGLPIVKSLIEKHGGAIELQSRPGEGTIVTLAFPVHRTVREATAPDAGLAAPQVA